MDNSNHHSPEEDLTTGDKLMGNNSVIDKLFKNQSQNEKSSGDTEPQAIQVVCISDLGKVRENNEDNYRFGLHDGIFLVADGMGGHQSGEVASRMVVDYLPQILEKATKEAENLPIRYRSIIINSIKELNDMVNEKAKEEQGLHGMGSTVAMVWLIDKLGTAYLANVGDSRIYYYRKGNLNQLSVDHSIVALLVMQGEIQPEETGDHPARGRLYRYIGMDGEAAPEIHDLHLQPDDILLLCSDGITDHLTDYRIQAILADHSDIKQACRVLVDAANKQGGRDNITAMLIKWTGKE